jgi:Uma2 family endonuclease
MITSIDQLDENKKYSYADYLTWRFDEYVELLRGKISRMAAPVRKHQFTAGEVHHLIRQFVNMQTCQVYNAPFDVRLLDNKKSTADKDIFTVVQPDVCVVCDISKLDDKGCLGAPDLIVEVLSPGTQKKDIKDKFELYEFNGVKEYWIVSINDEILTAFDLGDNNKFHFRQTYVANEKVFSKNLQGFKFKLSDIFEKKL